MKLSVVVASVAMFLTVLFVTLRVPEAPAAAPSVLEATTYQVDPVHSTILFKIRHMGVGNFYSRFNDFSGEFTFDPADPSAANFDIAVDANSVDTGNDGRDAHLRKADFFTTDKYTTISFKSTAVKNASRENMFELAGELTMLGETRPITATLEWIGSKTTPRGTVAGFEAVFTIKRSDFGMNYGVENGALGDEVKLIVAIEGKKVQAATPAE